MKNNRICTLFIGATASILFCAFFLSCGSNITQTASSSFSMDLSPLLSTVSAPLYTTGADSSTIESKSFYIQITAKSSETSSDNPLYYNYSADAEQVTVSSGAANKYSATLSQLPLGAQITVTVSIYYNKDLTDEYLAATGSKTFTVEEANEISLSMKLTPKIISITPVESKQIILLDTSYNSKTYSWQDASGNTCGFTLPTVTITYADDSTKTDTISNGNISFINSTTKASSTAITEAGTYTATVTYAEKEATITYTAYSFNPSKTLSLGESTTLKSDTSYVLSETITGTADATPAVSPDDENASCAWYIANTDATSVITISEVKQTLSFTPTTTGTFTIYAKATATVHDTSFTLSVPLKTFMVYKEAISSIVLSNTPSVYLITPSNGTWSAATGTAPTTLTVPSAALTYSDGSTETVSSVPTGNITYVASGTTTDTGTIATDAGSTAAAYAAPTTAGTYTYTVTYGNATASYTVTAYNFTLPTYTTTPTAEKYIVGEAITFTAAAAPETNLTGVTYGWTLNETDTKTFANYSSYNTLSYTPAAAGTSTITLKANATVGSDTYTLTFDKLFTVIAVTGNLAVTVNLPTAQKLTLGMSSTATEATGADATAPVSYTDTTTTLTFTATGYTSTGTPTYAWYVNGTALSSNTTNTITYTPAALAAAASSVINIGSTGTNGVNVVRVTVTENGVIQAQAYAALYYTVYAANGTVSYTEQIPPVVCLVATTADESKSYTYGSTAMGSATMALSDATTYTLGLYKPTACKQYTKVIITAADEVTLATGETISWAINGTTISEWTTAQISSVTVSGILGKLAAPDVTMPLFITATVRKGSAVTGTYSFMATFDN